MYYKGVYINITVNGYYVYYNNSQGRFLKFNTLKAIKESFKKGNVWYFVLL